MGTKKIREALWDMRHYGAGDQPRMACEALAELEAIERAATEWYATPPGTDLSQQTIDTFASIAEAELARREQE